MFLGYKALLARAILEKNIPMRCDMKIKLVAPLILLFFLSACEIPGAVIPNASVTETRVPTLEALPKGTPVCISSEPVQTDIDSALAYTGDLFKDPAWKRTYTVSEGSVAVTWSNDTLSAVAYLEALIFPCGYEEPDLDNFFNDENWKVIFANYESYEAVAECKTDTGLRLYQFKAVDKGYDYDIKYWAKNDTGTRVMGVMIVFPVESKSLMDEYSTKLFPELTSCK
jgi:hypothetical protein